MMKPTDFIKEYKGIINDDDRYTDEKLLRIWDRVKDKDCVLKVFIEKRRRGTTIHVYALDCFKVYYFGLIKGKLVVGLNSRLSKSEIHDCYNNETVIFEDKDKMLIMEL